MINVGVPELEEYKFGFHDDVEPVYSTGTGLTEEVVREISESKANLIDVRVSLKIIRNLP